MNSLTSDAGVLASVSRRWPMFAILVALVVVLAAWPQARNWSEFLLPWEFSPTVLLIALAALLLFARGVQRAARHGVRTGWWRRLSYYGSVLLLYLALQSQVDRSEENTSELQSLMRIPYAVF